MALNITVYLRTNKHNVKHDQHYPSITVKIPFAANSAHEFTRICIQALKAIWQPGYNYLKTGVRATGVIPAGEVQYNLYSDYESEREQRLASLMDDLNLRYGRGTLRIATEGYEKMGNEARVPEQTIHHRLARHCHYTLIYFKLKFVINY